MLLCCHLALPSPGAVVSILFFGLQLSLPLLLGTLMASCSVFLYYLEPARLSQTLPRPVQKWLIGEETGDSDAEPLKEGLEERDSSSGGEGSTAASTAAGAGALDGGTAAAHAHGTAAAHAHGTGTAGPQAETPPIEMGLLRAALARVPAPS
jgi:hypothetical protein